MYGGSDRAKSIYLSKVSLHTLPLRLHRVIEPSCCRSVMTDLIVMNQVCCYYSCFVQPTHSQVPFQPQFLFPDVPEENLSSVLHSADERPETTGPASTFPKFPVCVKGA